MGAASDKYALPEVPTAIAAPVRVAVLACAGWSAYSVRLHAIEEYGTLIHELDPWFNYRATEYLAHNGAERFFKWFDYMAWYPLGRPVGTTIYPGMQFTSVYIWNALGALGIDMSVNDVCCYVPAWFGVVATVFLYLLAQEAGGAGNGNAGACAALIMAIVPAHLMRSVGGEYDNECVAVSALCATFYTWCRALRQPGDGGSSMSWLWGAVAGLWYFYMAAAWGGFIFVTNMIALHALLVGVKMMATGTYESYLWKAYVLYFVIGSSLATTVPVIGWGPFRSLEQLSAMFTFGVLTVLEGVKRFRSTQDMTHKEQLREQLRGLALAAGAGVLIIMLLSPLGYFGPLSSRVRGLLVPHTRTGNPLVDSVSEHQPASPQAYYQMLHYCCWFAPFGFVQCLMQKGRGDAKGFLALYAVIAYNFSSKMNRLLLLMGPIAAALAGIAVAGGGKWALAQMYNSFMLLSQDGEKEEKPSRGASQGKKSAGRTSGAAGAKGKKSQRTQESGIRKIFHPVTEAWDANPHGRAFLGGLMLLLFAWCYVHFSAYSRQYAKQISNPQIVYKAYDRAGKEIYMRDYLDGYEWIRKNTPKDSRVIAWWDYGYQISGIANRTSIADGNTWNHEHIATLGRCLTSPVRRAHSECVRHLADYVLVWAGGGHDDLSKSPHMARIGNSVYNDICPGDPLCTKFGFKPTAEASQYHTEGDPTPMMANSLLFQAHSHGVRPGVNIDQSLFQEAYTSKYGKLRVFKVMNISQESKEWLANPANRKCDAPGSWYCPGQYPPAMANFMGGKKAFRQLEDFNVKSDDDSDQYHKSYMQRMAGSERGGAYQE